MREPLALPPLGAVRAFEAAARHGSFTKAAAELGTTQAAVSYQIKVLEERVGAPLFIRRPRQVTLTETGQRFALAAREALERLADAYGAARQGTRTTLSITTVATVAAHWLAPRLGHFQVAHPEIAVRVNTSPENRDLARDGFDIAIRGGTGHWGDHAAHRLMSHGYAPMLSPALAARLPDPAGPADLLKLPILDPGDLWWQRWFEAVGVDAGELAGRPRSSLGSQVFEAQAAMAGQGVAILTRAFFVQELRNGSLVQPFAYVHDDGEGYWLVHEKSRGNVPKIRLFREWVLEDLAAFLGQAP
ncbi:MAG: LysR family transcriptional regulator [Mesorhizobium amorphae]|nr:MAG: LysR family transcriptional regulator [Mesorhizobium amorphae]